ncbi:MAG: asparaginase [Thermoanaerobaculia bacterium]
MPEASPVVATVYRAGRVESVHRGFGAVADPEGNVLAGFGDVETPVYWRSAAKPFQAMPFLEAGGAAAFSLRESEIALACASHVGEPLHAETARGMLSKGGFSEADLRCGAHAPAHEASAASLARSGEPFTQLHNNCSGKHAAMLLACRMLGFDPKTYEDPEHPLQKLIRARIAFYSMFPEEEIEVGIDGCSLPVFRLPISRLATAYARLLAPTALPGESRDGFSARRSVVGSMTGCPFFVSGTGQFTTRFLEAGGGRWIGKEGAEGVYAIGLAAPARGIAFKIDDGAGRARHALAIDLMAKFGGGAPPSLSPDARPELRNARGTRVGEIVAGVPSEPGS